MATRKRVRLTALRQLVVGVTLTLFNLAGALLTLSVLGGRGEWSVWQFFGLFGLFEWATGIAIILGPNAWELPVRRAREPDRDLMLECRSLLIPHWAPGVKTASGFAFLVGAAFTEGVGVATLGVPFVVLFIVVASLALSLLFARFGVARPDLDVVHMIIRRPGHAERELPGISLSALVVQALLNILTIPTVKAFPPSFLYQPELGPSLTALAWTGGVAAALAGAAMLTWRGNMCWRSPSPAAPRAAEPTRARA